jgi:PAS domain S-box-containing protein
LVQLHAKSSCPHIQDLELDLPFPGTRKYHEVGIKRSLWAPLTHQGRTIGVLLLRSTKPDAFDHSHVASISYLATLIAPSIAETIRLWEDRQERQSTQVLNQSRESLSDVLDYRQALELICQKCCELLASSYAVLAEVEGDELVYRWAWLSGPPGPFQPDGKASRVSLKQPAPGLAARVALTGQPEIINYISEMPPGELDLELLGFPDVNSIMAVPMVESGRVIGVLMTGHRGTNQRFVNRHLLVAEAFAAHAATTLQNARLQQAAQDYSAEIALVAEISRILTSTLNIDEVYERFTQEVKKLVDFDRMNIHVIDDADGAFTIRHLSGLAQGGRRSGEVVPLEGTQTEQVIKTGQPAITYDYAIESRFRYDRDLLQSGLRSRICLPLTGRGSIIGSLTLHSRRVGAYGPREQAILERLAHQIGPAIENARLYEQVRFQAQLMDNVRESIIATDLEGRVTYWGKGAEALYGYSAPEVMGKPITFIVGPEEAEQERQRMQQALVTGSWQGYYIQQRKDGASFWASTSISLVRGSQRANPAVSSELTATSPSRGGTWKPCAAARPNSAPCWRPSPTPCFVSAEMGPTWTTSQPKNLNYYCPLRNSWARLSMR